MQTESTAHVLQNRYCFWYMRRGQAKRTENYEKSIKLIGTFNTVRRSLRALAVLLFVDDARSAFAQVESFWNIYSHMVRPDDLPNTTDYHLFKEGIKPIWEVRSNGFAC